MAGHSQFKNIMYRKGAQDKKRAKVFSRLSREISASVKVGGEDPTSNPRLRLAMQNARAENMPKDNIERAIKKAVGGEDETLDEVRYEGYGPGGVAVIIETLTDNRNRTGGAVRACFSKNGGNLGETGSVAFMFDHVGEIIYPGDVGTADDVLEAAIEAGADDVQSDAESHVVTCAFEDLGDVATEMENRLGPPTSVKPVWKPQTFTELDEENAGTLLKLVAALEDDDDVQNVYANFEVSDEVMARLTEA